MVTAGFDGGRWSARLWDPGVYSERARAVLPHDDIIHNAEFSRDGTRLVTTSMDGTARIWDAATGEPLSPPLEHPRGLFATTFGADSTRLITATTDAVLLWDIGAPLRPIANDHRPRKLDVSPDGTRYLAAVDGDDAHIRVHDAATRQAISAPIQRSRYKAYAAFSRDGARLIVANDADNRYTARVWDAATGKPLAPPLEHRATVLHAEFSRDGTRVVTASKDHTARIWSALTGQPITPLLMHNGAVVHAVFSPDGTRIVTVSGGAAQVWDASGKPLGQPSAPRTRVEDAEFSPDGMRVVTAGGHIARVWDAATGNPLAPPLEHRTDVVHAEFSPDGLRVLTDLDDNTSLAWEIPLDRGTLDDWIAVEQRSSYALVDGALSLRLPVKPAPEMRETHW
jgi:WD40 repeat protein